MSKKFTINRQVPKTTRDPVTGKFERASSYEEAPVGNKSPNLCPGAGAFKIIRQTTLYSKEDGTKVVKKTARCNIPLHIVWKYDEDDEWWYFYHETNTHPFSWAWYANLDNHEGFAGVKGIPSLMSEESTALEWFKSNLYPEAEVLEISGMEPPMTLLEASIGKSWKAFDDAILDKECTIRFVPYSGTFNLSIPEATIYDPDGNLTEMTFETLENLPGLTLYGKIKKIEDSLPAPWTDHPIAIGPCLEATNGESPYVLVMPYIAKVAGTDIYNLTVDTLAGVMMGAIDLTDQRNADAIEYYWDEEAWWIDDLDEAPNQPIGMYASFDEDCELIYSSVLFAVEVDFLAEETTEGYQSDVGMNKKKLQMAPNSEHNSEDATVGTPFNTDIDDAIIFNPTFDSFDTMESAATPKAVDGNATAKVNTHHKKAIDTLATEDFDN